MRRPPQNDHTDESALTTDRRTFASLLAGAGIATLAGCTGHLAPDGSADASRSVGPDATGLTDDERADFLDRMTERYGEEAAASIVPVDDPDARLPRPGIEPDRLVWDATEALTATDGSGDTAVESDNYAALYETDADDDEGQRYYLYWLWSSARPANGDAGRVRTVWNHVDLTNDADVTVYDPAGDRSANGTVGPHPDRTGQDTDEFAVRWEGDRDDALTVTGSCVERRSPDDERGFDWNVHLDGGT